MNHLKHKLIVFTLVFVGIFGYMSLIQAPPVSAGSLTYELECKDGTKKLSITKNNARHEVTVRCESGAKFTYLNNNPTARVVGSCPDPERPGTQVDNPNGQSTKLVFYCLNGSANPDHGQATRTNTTPTVNQKSVNNNGGGNTDNGGGEDCDTCATGIGDEYDENDCNNATDNLGQGDCEVLDMIVLVTNVLAGMAATIIVAMIIWGGIQYSTAGADPAKVQAAKQKIMSALLALLLLVFGFSIIQWLVPGGLL